MSYINPMMAKAFMASLAEQRRAIAKFYVEHPDATITAVMRHFKVSRNTVKRALTEAKVSVDRLRNPIEAGATYTQWICPLCEKRHRCYHAPQLEQSAKTKPTPDDPWRDDPDWPAIRSWTSPEQATSDALRYRWYALWLIEHQMQPHPSYAAWAETVDLAKLRAELGYSDE